MMGRTKRVHWSGFMLRDAEDEIKGLRRELAQTRKARLEELLEAEASERVEIEQRPAKGDMRESTWFRCGERYASAWGDKMDYVSIPGHGFRECEEIEDFICCLYAVLAEKRRREADRG